MRRLLTVMTCVAAAFAAAPVSPAATPAAAQTPTPTTQGMNLLLGDVLDLLTYRVRTVFVGTDGKAKARTVPALVGVPALVDVNGNLVPDVSVEILPLPPNLITVSYRRLLTAPPQLSLLAEVLVDVPGGVGATFGVDTRDGGNLPRAVRTTLTFGLGGQGTSLDLTVRTSDPASTPTMALLGKVFTKRANGEEGDPTAARIGLTPVPGELRAGIDANGDQVKPFLTATLDSDRATVADANISSVDGEVTQRASAVVRDVPQSASITVTGDKGDLATKADDQQTVTYRASSPITRLDAHLIQVTEGEVDGHIAAELTAVPASVDVIVAGTKTTVTAGQPLQNALVGFNLTEEDPIPEAGELPAEPVFAVAELDTLNHADEPLRSAVIRVPGVRSAVVDTGDPIVANLESAGGKLRALVSDTRESGPFEVDAVIDAMPRDATVTFSKKAGTLTYDADAPIEQVDVIVDDPDGFLKAPGAGGANPTHLDVTIEDIPGAIDIAFSPPEQQEGRPLVDTDDDGDLTDEGENLLARYDANGKQIGSLRALLTSGPDAPSVGTLPRDVDVPDELELTEEQEAVHVEDGVLVEDSDGRFVALARITGLRKVEVVKDGPREDLPGLAETQRAATAQIDVGDDRPFLVQVRRDKPVGDPLDATALLSNVAPDVQVDLFDIVGDVPCLVFGVAPCLPGRDLDGDNLIDEVKCESVQRGNVCVPADEAKDGELVDEDGDGFATFDCRNLFVVFSSFICPANDPDGNGLIDDDNLGVKARYQAGGTIDRIFMSVDPGSSAHPLLATVEDVAKTVEACFSATEACARVDDGPRNTLTFDLDADAPVTFSASQCLVDGDEQCTNASDRVRVQRLSVEDFSLELDARNDEDKHFTAVLDTRNKPVKGRITLGKDQLSLDAELSDVDGNGDSGITAIVDKPLFNLVFFAKPLPDGLTADRMKLVALKKGDQGLVDNVGGSISCPAGFNAELNFRVALLDALTFGLIGSSVAAADVTRELCGTE
jgi:hypothetical protein